MFLQIASLLTTILCLLYYYFTRNFNYWKNKNVVGPTPLPFFGNLKEFTLRRKHFSLIYKDIYDQYPNEKVVGIYRMTSPALLVRDPEIIKAIMIKDFDIFVDRGFDFNKGLGQNLFHADGNLWRALRSRFTPVFTSGKLKNMVYLVTERADKLLQHIGEAIKDNPEQEIQDLVQRYTIASISACAFGLDVDTNGDKLEKLKKIDKLIFDLNIITELDMMYPNLLKKFGMNLFPNCLNSFFRDIVKTAVNERNDKPSSRNDLIDLILALREEKEIVGKRKELNEENVKIAVTDDIIMAQTFVFYAGGYETSATTMGYMMRELAVHPEVQDKLVAEIDSVLERHSGPLTYETIQEMTYLSQVINETLRMYPIVDLIQRQANQDYKLPGTDLTINKGQLIIVPAKGLHWDPKYFPNPEKFDPERFSKENTALRHPAVHLPFGIGPRNCIGYRFTQIQMKVLMARFLSKFRVEATRNTPRVVKFSVDRMVIRPGEGYPMNIVPRKKTQ